MMKASVLLSAVAVAGCGLFLAGCETLPASAPPVTASFVQAAVRVHADGPTLQEGRRLYLNRCIQCHSLPAVAKYEPERLTAIVANMAGRANLNRTQHDAVLKYLLTARSQ